MTVSTPESPSADLSTETEVNALASERLTFFADAVIAIAITLLALDLPLPEGSTNAELLSSIGKDWHEYFAFLISFAVIGIHWRGHHRVFRYVTTLGGAIVPLSIVWLLMMVVTPFATRVLTGDGAFQVRFIFYAAVQAVASLCFLLMLRDLRRFKLCRPDTPPEMFTGATTRTVVSAAAFLIAIPVSLFTHWAYVCWALMPVGMRVARLAVQRRRHAIES
jgi:uncharacterized membrane protein